MPSSAGLVSDPVRLLHLLWSPTARSSRSGLSLSAIVAAATRVAAQEGVNALTMRRVAAVLDAAPMSLYTHVPGKAELLELMLDTHAAQIYDDGDVPASRPTWRAAGHFVAVRNFEAALAQPWTLDVPAGRPVPGPGITGKYELELAALEGIGLSDVEMDHALTGLLGLAHAAARAQVGLDRARGVSGRSDAEWWEQVGPALAAAMQGRQFPLAGRVGTAASLASDASADPRASLNYSVGLLLDGLEASRSVGSVETHRHRSARPAG
jgi:AcrR family transcriptional regulator